MGLGRGLLLVDKTAMAVRGYGGIIGVSLCFDVFLRVGREGKEDG